MMRWICIYECYENGQLIKKGTSDEIAQIVGCTRSSVNGYSLTGKTIYEKYTIKKVDKILVEFECEKRERQEKKKAKQSEREEKVLDYLVRHLKEYKNTVMPVGIKPDKYLERLKELGYECSVKKTPEIIDNKKASWYYILEVK